MPCVVQVGPELFAVASRDASGRNATAFHSHRSSVRALGSVGEDMQLQRFVGLVDLGVLTVVVVTLVLPAREMYAGPAYKASEAERFTVALAEARSMARPDDGAAVDELSRRAGGARAQGAAAGGERGRT